MLLICTASSGKNRALADRLHELAAEAGQTSKVIDLSEDALPLYTPAAHAAGMPAGLEPLSGLFREATSFAFVAPEYNGSIPPTLSNAIAWLSVGTEDFRELFNGKGAAIATHSGGGGQKVLVAMRLQLSHLGVNVLGRELLTSSQKPLNEDSARAVLGMLAKG